MAPLCSLFPLTLLALLVSLNSFTVAFQPSPRSTTIQLQAAKNNNNNNEKPKKKNPYGDAILFGKPQYNWVTGKTEEKMTSTYVHNWNVSRKRVQADDDAPKAGSAVENGGREKESGQKKEKAWFQLFG